MATEAIQMGKDAVLKIGSDEILDVTDVTLNLDPAMIATPTRRTARLGWTSESPGMKKLTIDCKLLVRTGETIPNSITSAVWAATPLQLTCLDKEDGEGPSGYFYVSKCQRGEPLEGAVAYDLSFSWTSDGGEDAPTWNEAGT